MHIIQKLACVLLITGFIIYAVDQNQESNDKQAAARKQELAVTCGPLSPILDLFKKMQDELEHLNAQVSSNAVTKQDVEWYIKKVNTKIKQELANMAGPIRQFSKTNLSPEQREVFTRLVQNNKELAQYTLDMIIAMVNVDE